MEERFTYDDMNRLTGVTQIRANARDMYCQTSYDLLGRMTSKQAVSHTGTTPLVSTVFSSPVFDNTKIHAPVTASMAPDVFPTASQSVSYTAFDKVRTVRQGNDSIRYTYGYDRQRILMEEWVGDTLRTKHYVGACERRNETTRATDTWRWWTPISGPFGVFAVMESGSGFRKLHYILKDNLGSWTVVTDDEGEVEQELSFDVWGNRRDPATWTNYTAGDTYARPMFDRGFTGHEHLQAFGLINMNGRMYDPVMSSFLSPDRYIQDPITAQGFNRYAYCMYNPLRYVDPTGWVFTSSHGSPPRSVSGLIQDYLSDPCYITRQQLRDAGIYCVEGGYGYVGGSGSMGAHWMEGFGIGHYTSWDIQTDNSGFEAGAWAIPDSFYPMWINYCQGLCNYGSYDCLNDNDNNNSMVSAGNEGGRNNSFVNKLVVMLFQVILLDNN